jgi:hypothetical protein
MRESTEESLSLHLSYKIESNESFSNSSYDNFINKGFSPITDGYLVSYSEDFDSNSDKVNHLNLIGISPINDDNNSFDINAKEEKDTNNQQNNLIIEIENKNKNSVEIEKPLITQESISQNKSNKGKKLLGRKKNWEKVNKPEGSFHDMYSIDNISAKTKTHFLNFIIALLNCIFPHCNYNKRLFKLDYEFKKNTKKKNVESLNYKTIGDIISNKISKKYKLINDKAEANKKICEEIKDNPILNKILSLNYLVFFKKFYYNSDSYINLKEYGLDVDIVFTKDVKNFKHLLKENEKRGNQYIMSIKRHVLKKYLPGSIFIC